jgi:ABC-type multidrug transport system fused ATPase/permease subunit
VQAKVSWFDATPIGRIVNRFSQDIVVIDQKLFPTLLQLIFIALSIVQVFIVIVVSIPFLLPFLIPIIICTQLVTNLYVNASREIKRLESVSKSPVFVLLSETLQGLSIIRSFQAEPRFYQECFRRVDDMNRCHLYMWLCNRWLNFKMQVFGGVTAGCVGLAIVLLVRWQASGDVFYISSTAAGLSLVYSLGFTDYFTWFARFYADNQLNMNAVERVLEFSSMNIENYSQKARDRIDHNFEPTTLISFMRDFLYIVNGNDNSSGVCSDITTPASHEVPSHFPKEGSIEFKNISLIYKSSAELFDSMSSSRDILSAPACVVTALTSAHSFWRTYVSKIFHFQGITRDTELSELTTRDVSQSIPVKVLSYVSFSIPAGHKVGIIGRTGAGKSSLVTALFRLTEPELDENAAIYIDGIDVLKIPLQTLRSNIGIVPQDPLLFKGSIRFNLDPFNRESDEKLWAALRQVQMDQSVLALPNSVESSEIAGADSTDLNHKMVTEKGGNLSVGQRQLLCMARAIIRGTKILVMDEATASCDAHTDALIQETLMTVFQDCTVFIIAHRLHTVIGCNKIIVMDAGRVVENGAPAELLRIEGGRFRGMCEVSGDMTRLAAMAANRQTI